MKKIISTTVVGFLALATVAFAQSDVSTTPAPTTPVQSDTSTAGQAVKELEMQAKALTQEMEAKIKAIREEYKAKIDALRSQTKMKAQQTKETRKAVREERKDIKDKAQAERKAIQERTQTQLKTLRPNAPAPGTKPATPVTPAPTQ